MADEASATNEAADDREQGVHRLRDIVVQEVSLVDRAANKRRFLVVKRSDMPNGNRRNPRTPEEQAGTGGKRGGAKTKQKAKPADAGKARRRPALDASGDKEDEETEKARGRRPGRSAEDVEADKANDKDDDDEDVETDKANDDEDDDDETDEDGDVEIDKADHEEDDDEEDDEEDTEDGAKAGARTRAAAGAAGAQPARGDKPTVKDDDGDEEADDEGDFILPLAAKTAILRVLAQALERLMGVANRVKEAEEPDDETEANVPDEIEGELEDIGELLEDVAEQLPTTKAASPKADVTKAGRRMAKDRLDRFQKALEMLAHVLKELTEAKQPTRPGSQGADKTQKAQGTAGLESLVASIDELTTLVKRQQDELAGQRRTRATSNAISVEGGRRRDSQDVAWPLDMNRPISRDTVSKSVSFFDD